MEWYGGGPEFPRKIISLDNNKYQVELYPPILYGYLCESPETDIKSSVTTLVLSSMITIAEVKIIMERKYNKNTFNTRIWFRFRNTYKWILENDLKKTVQEIKASEGDNFMLEAMANGRYLSI